MNAVDGGGAHARVLILSDVYSPILQQLFVELLQVSGGQLLQLDVPNAGDRIGLDDQFIPVGRSGADIGLGIELISGTQPACYGILIRCLADI